MNAFRKIEITSQLSKHGNSTGLTLTREVLQAAGLARGDEVVVSVSDVDGSITVRKADDDRQRAMEIGKRFMARYRHALAELAK